MQEGFIPRDKNLGRVTPKKLGYLVGGPKPCPI